MTRTPPTNATPIPQGSPTMTPARPPSRRPMTTMRKATMALRVRWVGSPNFTPGRAGHNPNWTPADPNSWIVMHTMVGTMAGTVAAFQSPARQASSTYGVGLDGSIVQFVKETDAAWANGTYADNPGSNLDSISI